jgi:hypothetical protein
MWLEVDVRPSLHVTTKRDDWVISRWSRFMFDTLESLIAPRGKADFSDMAGFGECSLSGMPRMFLCENG